MHHRGRSIPHISKKSGSDETYDPNWKTNWDYRKPFKKNNEYTFNETLYQFTPSSGLDKHLLLGVLLPSRASQVDKSQSSG